MAFEAHPDLRDASLLDSTFDNHARANRLVAAVLPSVESEADLVRILNSLPGRSGRWRLVRRNPSDADRLLVGLEWRTSAGDRCDVMGFAPFITMPVLRRGPYVALALWPGGRGNPWRESAGAPPITAGRVGFIDSFHALSEEKYQSMRARTEEDVRSLEPKKYYTTAFVLPLSLEQDFVFSP